jgi:dihydropteroate synthase
MSERFECRATLAAVRVGDGLPVAVMGVLNVSPESFHAASVHRDPDALLREALAMVRAGAALVDVGARSTAPYLATEIDESEEAERLAHAVGLLAAKLPVPVSADTARRAPARAALEAGARVLNDVSGLADPAVARLAAEHEAGVIAMAAPAVGARGARADRHGEDRSDAAGRETRTSPVATLRALLAAVLERARAAGIPEGRIVLDPGIGFFRDEAVVWHEWDTQVLAGLPSLRALGRPLAVGVSRKSFIGALTGHGGTVERLAGSLAATAAAVLGGAALVRTHDVAETVDAVRVAERIRAARP